MNKISPVSNEGNPAIAPSISTTQNDNVLSINQKNFKTVLGQVQSAPAMSANSTEAKVLGTLSEVFNNWQSTDKKLSNAMSSMKGEAKNLIELQMIVNRLGMQVQFMSHVGESFSGTLRRLQQLAGS